MSKLYVSDPLLEKLKCSICDAYLSIFPVNIKNDGSSPICGRCNVPNEHEYFRDEGYEGIIQHFIFPCIHSKHGCTTKLTPVELKNHELCCLNRKLDCPSRAFASCKWQGSNSELLTHFEDAHKTLLLSDGKFELNFITSVKENLLMPYDEELFIVKKEVDSRSGAFTCSVEQVIQSEEPTNYNYIVRVTTGNNTHYHICPEKSTSPHVNDKVTRFNAEFIREKLSDPAVIIAKIELVKSTDKDDDEPSKKVEQVNPDIEWDILEDLQCPVCYDYMVPPIYQCTKGHSICNACKPKLQICPLCKGPLSDTQNFTLEKLTGRMKYPCKHHKMGCPVLLPSTGVRKHESSCEYGPYLCPLSDVENCTVKCNKSEVIEHIENNHVDSILKTDKISIPFSGVNEVLEKYYLINFSNKIFKVCFKYQDKKFRWAVQLIGPAEDSLNYKFEIDVVDNSGSKLRQYIRGFCTAYTEHTEWFDKPQNCVCLLHEQISNFISENFTYRIRVLKD